MHQVIYAVYCGTELFTACTSEAEAQEFIDIDTEVNDTDPGDYMVVKYVPYYAD